MTEITNAPRLPGDQPFAPLVGIELIDDSRSAVTGYAAGTAQTVQRRLQFRADGNNEFSDALGEWSVDLVPNAWIVPEGTLYRVTEQRGRSLESVHIIEVPEDDGPYTVLDVLVDPPGSAASQLLAHLTDEDRSHDAASVYVEPVGNLAAEDAQSAFAELDAQDTAEAAARASADTAEATARGAADEALTADLATETTARITGDSTHAAALAAHLVDSAEPHAASDIPVTAISGLAAGDVQAALAEHQFDIDAEVVARTAAVDAEAARAVAAETALSADISGLDLDVAAIDLGLADEIADRTAAVSAEADTRSAADTAEASTRATADTVEAAARAAADTTLTNNLAAEVLNRAAAVTGEATARANADTAEATARASADTTEANARLAHEADSTGVHGIADTSQLVVGTDPRLADERVPTDSSVDQTKVVAGSLGIDRLAVDPTDRDEHHGTQPASSIDDLGPVVQAYRLDQFAAPAAAVDLAGQRLVNGALPVAATDVITKEYADGLRAGLLLKADPVRVMVATNVNINAPGAVHDGATLTAGVDSILLTGQTSGNDNGLYLYNGAAVPLTRRSDANTSAEMRSGTAVWVLDGTYADQRWALVTADPITLGVTAQVWAFDGGLAMVTAGDGLTKTGNRLDIGEGTGLEVAADSVGIAAGGVGTTQLADAAVTDDKVDSISQGKVTGLVSALAALVPRVATPAPGVNPASAGAPHEVYRLVMEDGLPAGVLARNIRFLSTPDPAIFFGHNINGQTGRDPTKPGTYLGIESDYNDGSFHKAEIYLEYQPPAPASFKRWVYGTANRTTHVLDTLTLRADFITLADDAANSLLATEPGSVAIYKPLNLVGDNPVLSLGTLLTPGDSALALDGDPASASSVIRFLRGGAASWQLYRAAGTDVMFLRDMVNARMHATFTGGASPALATTEINSAVTIAGTAALIGEQPTFALGTADTAGDGQILIDGNSAEAAGLIRFLRNGAGAWQIIRPAGFSQYLGVYDLPNGKYHLLMTSGAGVGGLTEINSAVKIGGNVGFYNATPVAQPTGVAVTAEAIHAALVTLGLIAA